MNLRGLVGAVVGELDERLGTADARRKAGGDLWLVYRRPEATLRVRCVAEGDGDRRRSGRVASWTLTWEEPRRTLRRAVEPLGLWPACAPDVDAGAAATKGGRLVRRALPDPSGPGALSLTAGLSDDGFGRVAVFDEEPEWM